VIAMAARLLGPRFSRSSHEQEAKLLTMRGHGDRMWSKRRARNAKT